MRVITSGIVGSRQTVRSLAFAILLAASSSGLASAATGSHSATFTLPAGKPVSLAISRIGVHASIESLTLRNPNDVKAPYRWQDVGWYSLGARPGALGHAVIFGHLDSTCCPAVFWNLKTLRAGDSVQVGYPGSKQLTFRVLWQHTYANAALPTNWMFSAAGQRGLVLYTCAGIFHHDGTGYDHKLVVYARLVLPGGRLG